MEFNELNKYNFILASKSPRRQFLLQELGLKVIIQTKEVDENFPNDLKAEQIPLYLAEKKANAFNESINDNTIVITADTIVWINNQVLNKPENYNESVNMLQLLSNNKHEVFTGVCLKSKNKTHSFYTKTEVHFKDLSLEEIDHYIKECNPYDKAGSYGAQECLPLGMNPCSLEEIKFLNKLDKKELINSSIKIKNNFHFIEKINGSYFNVMGLPLKELFEELQEFIK